MAGTQKMSSQVCKFSDDAINSLIAVRVMGESKPKSRHDQFHVDPIESEGGNWYCLTCYEQGDKCQWYPMPFSEGMYRAWKVVERIIGANYTFKLETSKVGCTATFLKAGIVPYSDNGVTAPEAICKAALKLFP